MERSFLENLLGTEEGSGEVIEQILNQHQKEMQDVVFAGTLSKVIADAGGRNEKAVAALLDMETIRASDDPRAAAVEAVQQLKKEQDYLFVSAAPRYAPGTGTGNFQQPEPKSLAEALRQKFHK